jgi:hypothetical protein
MRQPSVFVTNRSSPTAEPSFRFRLSGSSTVPVVLGKAVFDGNDGVAFGQSAYSATMSSADLADLSDFLKTYFFAFLS